MYAPSMLTPPSCVSPQMDRTAGRVTLMDLLDALRKGIGRADQLDVERMDPGGLRQLAHQRVNTPVTLQGAFGSYERRRDVEVPQAVLGGLDPARAHHREIALGEPLGESLPVVDVAVYQYFLTHRNIPCFLSMMAL